MTARFRVSAGPLSVEECVAAVARPEAGGIDVFIGAVRNASGGKVVTVLEYEAYASMAEKEMGRIGAEIEAEIPGARVAAVHRVGRLVVGDLAIVCAASAPHRAEAFAACRLLIDRIKERVPVWKREHGPDGPYWVGWEDARCAPGNAHEGPHHHGERE
ncbi:MAG TPA: molybdenum cofactor biosynthesis protein MoaE [Polyangiaceae bacterium]|nr:molybdenum cofactor biosynthesis protein MoaE [Polyangiaceae bacterium]